MKKYLNWALVIGLVLLDWAALDDITTGNEPDYNGEYAILALSAVIIGWIIWQKIRAKTQVKK